ncbi:MAG: BadF/BadG/BcrA/BcrD ATPase family protein [Cellulomonas sp.]
MTDLILAVDGGQTGTVAVLVTTGGTIRGVGFGGPIRHHEEPDAERFVRDALGRAVTGAMSGAHAGDVITVSCLAMTGSATIADRLIRELVEARKYVTLESDTLAALASGTAGGGGIGLIAGTGTVALAHGRRADDVLLGGWGWLLGDEGGGFWIAMEALKAAARDVDGTAAHTALTPALLSRLGQPDMRGVYNLVTGSRLDRTAIAALTTTVVAIAEAGDPVAAGILDRAADRLADLVVATVAAAPFLELDERLVVPSGGVLRPGGWVVKRLTDQLAERAPEFDVVVPQVPPVIGAYYLALRAVGAPIDHTLRDRVTEQVRSLATLTSKTATVPPTYPTDSL